VEEAARKLGLQLIVFQARTATDIDTAFAAFVRDRAKALVVSRGALLTSRRKQVIELAATRGLPAIYPFREFAVDGGLISYGTVSPLMLTSADEVIE
jgi:putative ABC transport system substrate-binding protein